MRIRAPLLIALTCACSSEPAPALCAIDDDCAAAQICQSRACVSVDSLRCSEADSTRAAWISVEPTRLDFGTVGGIGVRRTTTAENAGDCTLQISSTELLAGASSRFRCLSCEETPQPFDLHPGRVWAIDIDAQPGPPGEVLDTLTIQSSDPNQRFFEVALSMRSEGAPEMVVAPEEVDFGFVAAGSSRDRSVEVLNSGAGSTPLSIISATVQGTDSSLFSIEPALQLPAEVIAAREDPSAKLAINLRYSPDVTGAHEAQLQVISADGAMAVVALSSVEAPPAIQTSPASLDFGLVRLGRTENRLAVVQNGGASRLEFSARFMAGASDFGFTPQRPIFVVEPGSFVELVVLYAPTVAGPVSDVLILESNDPNTPSVSIPLSGMGETPPPGDEVVTVELEFRNNSSSPLDTDIRDVDLLLESPLGQLCAQADPAPSWGPHGNPQWSGVPGQGSERIVLSDVTQDGSFTVSVAYIEDCSSLPTELIARLLGIGSSELIDYFSDGDVMLDAQEVAMIVEQYCVNRRAAQATIRIKINGVEVAAVPAELEAKGGFDSPVVLVRQDSRFSAVPQ